MRLFLFRHGDKARDGSDNPPLTEKGLIQALSLSQLVSEKRMPKPEAAFSSPRNRAQQTFQALCDNQNIALQIMDALDERHFGESREQFRERVLKLLETFPAFQGPIYVVSHMDWLDEVLHHMPLSNAIPESHLYNIRSGQFFEFEFQIEYGSWQFIRTAIL